MRLDNLKKKDKHRSSLSQSFGSSVGSQSSINMVYSSIEMDEWGGINAVKPAAKAALDQHQLPGGTAEELEYDIKMEIDLELPQGRRHMFLSLSILPVEKAAYNHTVGWGLTGGDIV
jgi:hypothetical protein